MGAVVSLVANVLNAAGYIGYCVLNRLFNWDDQPAIENYDGPINSKDDDSELECVVVKKEVQPIEECVVVKKEIQPIETINYYDFKMASI